MLDLVGPEYFPLDQIIHSAWSSGNDMNTFFDLGHVFTDIRASDARMAQNVHVLSKRHHCLLDVLGKSTGWSKDECLRGLN